LTEGFILRDLAVTSLEATSYTGITYAFICKS